jgi:hypothetical protein
MRNLDRIEGFSSRTKIAGSCKILNESGTVHGTKTGPNSSFGGWRRCFRISSVPANPPPTRIVLAVVASTLSRKA